MTLDAFPARQDPRRESWKPVLTSVVPGDVLKPWRPRRIWMDDYVEDSMCALNAGARARPDAKSLALVRPREVSGLHIEPHGGWTPEEQGKIDRYVRQMDLFSSRDRTPLEAPRFRARYRYRCHEPRCRGHQQGLLDWEFVSLQRRLAGRTDDEVRRELERKFLEMMCDPRRDVAFYVGNQAKRVQTFSVLGVYYPER